MCLPRALQFIVRKGKLQFIVLCKQGDDSRVYRSAFDVPPLVLPNKPKPDLNFLIQLQHTLDEWTTNAKIYVMNILFRHTLEKKRYCKCKAVQE